jgi:hypothetical protein
MIPRFDGGCAMYLGARDGHFSQLLAKTFAPVVALDLCLQTWGYLGVHCVSGDETRLEFGDESFDLVVCTDVLEHPRSHQLADAATEFECVTRPHLLVVVPLLRDIRIGRTTCNKS